ncbi:Hsp20/alpha crystallin family protein [Spirochaetota bacterium]
MKWGLRKRDNSEFAVDKFFDNIDGFFDDFFHLAPKNLFENEWLPKIDIEEDEKEIRVKAEVPGFEEKNISVSLEENVLKISGEINEERKEEDKRKNHHVLEKSYGSFKREIALPKGIKAGETKAEYKKGVLHIVLPKDESEKLKMVKVKVH